MRVEGGRARDPPSGRAWRPEAADDLCPRACRQLLERAGAADGGGACPIGEPARPWRAAGAQCPQIERQLALDRRLSAPAAQPADGAALDDEDRKSKRLNSSH